MQALDSASAACGVDCQRATVLVSEESAVVQAIAARFSDFEPELAFQLDWTQGSGAANQLQLAVVPRA